MGVGAVVDWLTGSNYEILPFLLCSLSNVRVVLFFSFFLFLSPVFPFFLFEVINEAASTRSTCSYLAQTGLRRPAPGENVENESERER